MAHQAREKYSELVMAKLRASLVLEDGVVFNNDYEGDPVSGSVKIPVRDDEVAVSDYDKANGIQLTHGSTTYTPLLIDKDKAVNELIDGFDAVSVPGKLVADRLDSAGYSLARQMDTDGATTLLAGATVKNVDQLTAQNIYSTIVDIRTDMSRANIPDDGKRYLLCVPEVVALLLNCPQFVRATQLGDAVVTNGTVGKVAGFLVKEWNDTTANLSMIAGHPKFATRAKAWGVAVHVQDLSGSGNYIGACAVQGRKVYGHKVLRSAAIRAVYSPGSLGITLAASDAGKTIATVTGGSTYAYKLNPASRVTYDMTSTAYGGTSLTSGSTKIEVNAGDILEIVSLTSSKVKSVGYVTVTAADIGT